MFAFFLVCAAVGTTIMLIQFVLTLFGMGGDDMAGDVGGGDVHVDFHDVAGGGHDFAGDGHGMADGVHDGHVGDAHGHDAHHGSSWFFGVLSFRALVAAVAFFGWGGMAALSAEMSPYVSFLLAVTLGFAAMVLVAWLLRLLYGLTADGTAHIDTAVGSAATVYLTIPPRKTGAGKVTVNIQNRTMEYRAMTSDDAIPTGASVVVVDVLGPDVLEVAMSPEKQPV